MLMGEEENTGFAAASSEMEESGGRKDAGVLRDGKTSFSGNKSMRGAAVGLSLPSAVWDLLFLFTSSSFIRLGRNFEAGLCANRAGAAKGFLAALDLLTAPGLLLGMLMLRFSLSSAHSNAASRYAGEKDGLVFRPTPSVSPVCSDLSMISARLPATPLPRWPDLLGVAGLRLVLVAVVEDMSDKQGAAVTGSSGVGPVGWG